MENEILDLIHKYENNEISYKDFYYELQKFPSSLRDKVLAAFILGVYNND
jgi:hypothetical protein